MSYVLCISISFSDFVILPYSKVLDRRCRVRVLTGHSSALGLLLFEVLIALLSCVREM